MNKNSIACDLTALDAAGRERRAQLFAGLRGRAGKIESTSTGYRLQYPAGAGLWMTASELVVLERRCCPFLHFQLSVDENDRVTLMLGGGEGVKEFLAKELGLPPGRVRSRRERGAIAALFAPILAAATAVFCCVGPLLLAAAGIASAGFGMAVSRYRLPFAAATVVLAAIGFIVLYRPGRPPSGDREDASPPPVLRLLFWVGAGVSLAAAAASLLV